MSGIPAVFSFWIALTRICSWERGRTLDDDAVSWLWASCVSKHIQLEAKAKALQLVACEVIRQGFLEYDIESAELLEDGHVFSRHFRAEKASRDSSTGMQALIDAAARVEMCCQGSTTRVAQYHSTQDTQARQQLGAPDEGLSTGQVHGFESYGLPQTQSDKDHGVPSRSDKSLATPAAAAVVARSSVQSGRQQTDPSGSTFDPYVAGHNRLQDGLGSQLGEQDIGPTAHATGSRQSDLQIPVVLPSAPEDQGIYERGLTAHWMQEMPRTNATNDVQSLHDVDGPRAEYISGDSYVTIHQSTGFLQEGPNRHFTQPGQGGVHLEPFTAPMAPVVDESWPDCYYPSMFDGLIEPFDMNDT